MMTPSQQSERRALALYVVASNDFIDYLDMLSEAETTLESLHILRKMCELSNNDPKHDADLNKLMLPYINGRIEQIRADQFFPEDKVP